jgi:two-component system response regulator PilR (NtrC family)
MKPDTVTPSPKSESERGIVAVMQILIVEDHQDSREQLNGCLTRRGYTVAAAGDLETGIDFLGKQSFDAIIADIVLPDGTGYALISEVRQRGIHTLCIAVSGYPYPSDVEEPGATGFHYHLSKPINCDRLCSLLNGSHAGAVNTIEVRPSDGGWKVFEAPRVEAYFAGGECANEQALDYAKRRQESNSRPILIFDSTGVLNEIIATPAP